MPNELGLPGYGVSEALGVSVALLPGVTVEVIWGDVDVEGEPVGDGVSPGVRVEEGEGVEEGESPGVRVEEGDSDALVEEEGVRVAKFGVPVPAPPLVNDPEVQEVGEGLDVEVVEEVGVGVGGVEGEAPPSGECVGAPMVGVLREEDEALD